MGFGTAGPDSLSLPPALLAQKTPPPLSVPSSLHAAGSRGWGGRGGQLTLHSELEVLGLLAGGAEGHTLVPSLVPQVTAGDSENLAVFLELDSRVSWEDGPGRAVMRTPAVRAGLRRGGPATGEKRCHRRGARPPRNAYSGMLLGHEKTRSAGAPHVFMQCRYCVSYTLTFWGKPASSQPVGTILPMALAYFVSPCHDFGHSQTISNSLIIIIFV